MRYCDSFAVAVQVEGALQDHDAEEAQEYIGSLSINKADRLTVQLQAELHLGSILLVNMAMSLVQVEAELQDLDAEEAQEYLESLGVDEGGLKSLILVLNPVAMCILLEAQLQYTAGQKAQQHLSSLCN